MKKILAGLMLACVVLTATVAYAVEDDIWHCNTTGCGWGLPDGAVRIKSMKNQKTFAAFIYHHCWNPIGGGKKVDGRFAFTSPDNLVDKVEVDYLRLWKHNSGDNYTLVGSGSPGILNINHDDNDLQLTTTSDYFTSYSSHPEYHTEARYRIQWPDGWSNWRLYNSDDWDHPCSTV